MDQEEFNYLWILIMKVRSFCMLIFILILLVLDLKVGPSKSQANLDYGQIWIIQNK